MNARLNHYAATLAPVFANLKFAVWKPAGWNVKTARQCVIGLLLLQLFVVAAVTWQIKRRAHRELDAARAGLERQAIVPTEKTLLRAISGNAITLMQSSNATRSLARFGDAYFAATDGGLLELTLDGKFKRRLTVLDGLPESDLTALAVFNSQLFIGTRSQGLVSFDGVRFSVYRWTDRKAQAVTALLEDRAKSGCLLVGTFAGGLLEFDGKEFRERNAEQKRIAGIQNLLMVGNRLYVATFADGFWGNEAGRWMHFTVADGLPSNRVIGVIESGGQLIVATDFGVAGAAVDQVFNAAQGLAKNFQTLATLPSLTSIARYGDSILLSKDNGEIFQLVTDSRTHRSQLNSLIWNRPDQTEFKSFSSCQLHVFSGEPSLWLLSNEGIWRTGWQDERISGRMNFIEFVSAASGSERSADESRSTSLAALNPLASNLVSSLAIDDAGNLWAGSFRNGIDVFTREGRKLTHLESEAVREINSLTWNATSKQMIASTAQGLILFDTKMQPQQLTVADGLLSDSIQHAVKIPVSSSATSANPSSSPLSGELVLATSRGLSFGANNKNANQWRALTSAQGLPSNSVYAVLAHSEFIYAGTLNGLAQISAGRVVRVFNDSNSKLAQNWVTALCAIGGRLFVGTYGGGVFELTPSGEFISFASEIGKQTVNPNAMATDGQRLYVGTLDGGWTLDMRSQKWIKLRAELPSATVLSVSSSDQNVYFGTTSGIARVNKKLFELVREL